MGGTNKKLCTEQTAEARVRTTMARRQNSLASAVLLYTYVCQSKIDHKICERVVVALLMFLDVF